VDDIAEEERHSTRRSEQMLRASGAHLSYLLLAKIVALLPRPRFRDHVVVKSHHDANNHLWVSQSFIAIGVPMRHLLRCLVHCDQDLGVGRLVARSKYGMQPLHSSAMTPSVVFRPRPGESTSWRRPFLASPFNCCIFRTDCDFKIDKARLPASYATAF